MQGHPGQQSKSAAIEAPTSQVDFEASCADLCALSVSFLFQHRHSIHFLQKYAEQ